MAITAHAPPKSKTTLARELGISRQSLYYAPKLPAKDMALKKDIENVMAANPAYGHKRIAMELCINKKRVLRVMKLFGLAPKRRHKKPEKQKDIGFAPMDIPNRIRGMLVTHPNQVWVADFTYLPFLGRFLYLATVEDLFTRKILGWAVSVRHTADLVTEALLDALSRHPKPDIFHSDQGSEYRSKMFLKTLERERILCSMSEKGSPTQNGYKESFYSQFKLELGHPECYETMGELIEAIAIQIHYYNTKRIHTALKCAPDIFAKRFELNLLPEMKTKVLIV
jgi:putative transposase